MSLAKRMPSPLGFAVWLLLCAIGLGCASTGSDQAQSSKPPEPGLGVPTGVAARGEWLELEAALKKRLYANPQDATAYQELAVLYHRQRLYTASQSAFERALAFTPDSAEMRFAYANMLAEYGRDGEAYRQVETAIDLNPNDGNAHTLSGILLQRAGRNGEARAAFEKGWSCRPPSVAAGYELASWDRKQRSLAAALGKLELCLIHDPESAAVRRLYAEVLEETGKPREAARQWELLLARGEGGEDGNIKLANLYGQIGEGRKSEENLEIARRLVPNDPAVHAIAASLTKRPVVPPVNSDYRPLLPAK